MMGEQSSPEQENTTIECAGEERSQPLEPVAVQEDMESTESESECASVESFHSCVSQVADMEVVPRLSLVPVFDHTTGSVLPSTCSSQDTNGSVQDMERINSGSITLPPVIDQRVAVYTLRSQRHSLLLHIHHCLPELANSLLSESAIPKGVLDISCNSFLNRSQRGVALLDCVEARIREVPSDLIKLVHILKSKPDLESAANRLVRTYCTLSNAPMSYSPATSSAISHCHTSSTSLPPTIDLTVAVYTFRSQRAYLLRSICFSLPELANSLLGEFMIPKPVYDMACNATKDVNERSIALLDCLEAGFEREPLQFTNFVRVLSGLDPFLESQAETLVSNYMHVTNAISSYRTYLKAVYKSSPISPENKWPPTPSKEYVTLTVVEDNKLCRDEYIGHTLQGNVDQVIQRRKKLSVEQILEAPQGQKLRLVVVEGAPGIGKSTFAWELCRKWEVFSCMKQYNLVILLRLREKRVQNITTISELFYSYESEYKKALVDIVLKYQGEGILFILDGFDELPRILQLDSCLLNLIKGTILPESTVLVTSRPSATAELLTTCRPQIQKHIEILGFTQESAVAYAASIFGDEPQTLANFIAYISNNPAINSLMYVPLNAAIVVEIYRRSKPDVLPQTLTELYTQLCLTILARYLCGSSVNWLRVTRFKDLPSDLHNQLLRLSQVAFEGIINKVIVFYSLPPDFVQFGFLDAVPCLYGGGEISYNFLNFTLQQYFTAYHISQMDNRGVLELFKRYGSDYRWNIVWRFVAGLTKFKSFGGCTDVCRDKFFASSFGPPAVNLLFIQCSFEAHSMEFFDSSLRTLKTLCVGLSDDYKSLDMYAVGYCIANIPISIPWVVEIYNSNFKMFVSGLETKVPAVGVIETLAVKKCQVGLADLKYSFLKSSLFCHLNQLKLWKCISSNADWIHLAGLIPQMTCLKKLDIRNSPLAEGCIPSLFQQLCRSNVTSLDIRGTGFCKLFRRSPHNYHQLIAPTLERLEELCFGDGDDVGDKAADDNLMKSVYASSSLKSLSLYKVYSSLSPIKNNTRLIELHTELPLLVLGRYQVLGIIDTVKYNKVLQYLKVYCHTSLDSLKDIARAVLENDTLRSVELTIGQYDLRGYLNISDYMKTEHKELIDPRIMWFQIGHYMY